jgi:hypothetical protein
VGLGTFRIVLFAQSFHWTDRDRVAATVFGMLAPRGAFVRVSDRKHHPPARCRCRHWPRSASGKGATWAPRRHTGPDQPKRQTPE